MDQNRAFQDLNDRYRKLLQEHEDLQDRYNVLNVQHSSLQEEQAQHQDYDQLIEQVSKLTNSNDVLNRELMRIQSLMAERESAYDANRRQVSELKEQGEQLEKIHSRSVVDLEKQLRHFKDVAAHFEYENGALRKQMEQGNQMQEQLKKMEKYSDGLNQELIATRKKLAEKEQAFEAVRMDLLEMSDSKKRALEIHEKVVKDLEQRLESVNATVEHYGKENVRLQDQWSRRDEDMQALVDQLQKEIRLLSNQNEELRGHLDEEQKQREAEKAQKAVIDPEIVEQLKQELKAANEVIKRQKEELADCIEEIHRQAWNLPVSVAGRETTS